MSGSKPVEIGNNLWLQRHPLTMLGCRMGRNVSLIRLSSGRLIIHSTAPFSQDDLKSIQSLGEPGWLVEATCFHDTCSVLGTKAFDGLPYLVPSGFPTPAGIATSPLMPAPEEWTGEVTVIELPGMPKIHEHVFFHHDSRTLIVADLFFNLPPSSGSWTRGFLRLTAGIREYPGMSRIFRMCIKERKLFKATIRSIMDLDFDRIIVGHGEPILTGAKTAFRGAIERAGLR